MMVKIALTLSLLVSFSAAKPSGYYSPMPSYQPMTYAQPTYAAPSYDVHDVVSVLSGCLWLRFVHRSLDPQTKIVDYDYAVNDYYGNEQMRQEHVEPGKQVGHWSARMADGAMETVTYEAGPYGNLEHIVIRSNDYAAPVHSYAAPTYSAPAYSAPSYSAPAYHPQTYVAPKMHYNYEEKNIYVPHTYAAPQSYAAPSHY